MGAEKEAAEQVAPVDRMLLNKIDLRLSEFDPDRIETIRCWEQSELSVNSVLNIGGRDVKLILKKQRDSMHTGGERQHDTSVTSLHITQVGDAGITLSRNAPEEITAKAHGQHAEN